MKAENNRTLNVGDLRARAEKSLRKTRQTIATSSMEDIQRVVHDLQVHEIELQMQNEELRRTQQELEEACERYAHLYEFAPTAHLTLGEGSEILEANLAASNLLGMERRRLIKQKFTRFIREQSQDDFYLLSRLVQATGTKQTDQLELKSASGTQLTVRIDGIAEGKSVYGEACYRISLTDITDSKRAQEALQNSETNLTEFFHNAPIGLQWLGFDGTILRANRTQLDMLGYNREDYLGRRFVEFDQDQGMADELIGRLAARETIHNFRTRLRHTNGTIRFVLIDATSHWNQGEFVHSSIFTRDITERVDLEQELLQISEREHRRIAQDLHDDLGQLLTATIHLSTTLHNGLSAQSLPEATEAARILAILQHALLQTRSLARGLHPVSAEPNGLMAALEELVSRTEKLFLFPCRLNCPHPVMIDDNAVATHLYRIAQEAVTNAIKHGKTKRIEIGLSQMSKRITVMIKDNGVGLTETEPKKSGMGLRIMHYRAGMIGGSLVIQKKPRGGTEVVCSVHMPKTKPQELKEGT